MNKHCHKCGALRPLSQFIKNTVELNICLGCREVLKAWRDRPAVKARNKENRRTVKNPVPPPYGKECSVCKTFLPKEEFSPDSRARNGLNSECRDCSRRRGRERGAKWRERRKERGLDWKHDNYGVTIPEYKAMLAAQDGCCAICKKSQDGKALAIDHDHFTGTIRELLCDLCNRGLGMFRDNQAALVEAVEYLQKHAESPSGKIIPFRKKSTDIGTADPVAAEANWHNVT